MIYFFQNNFFSSAPWNILQFRAAYLLFMISLMKVGFNLSRTRCPRLNGSWDLHNWKQECRSRERLTPATVAVGMAFEMGLCLPEAFVLRMATEPTVPQNITQAALLVSQKTMCFFYGLKFIPRKSSNPNQNWQKFLANMTVWATQICWSVNGCRQSVCPIFSPWTW